MERIPDVKLYASHRKRTPAPIIFDNLLRGELSYLAPLGSENISAAYFKVFISTGGWGGAITPRLSQTPRLPVLRQK